MLENWKLIEVVNRLWVQDTIGFYTVINFTAGNKLRVDVMNTLDIPVVTIQGDNSEAVYKGLADWFDIQNLNLSNEHAMYIGSELVKAETQRTKYKQS